MRLRSDSIIDERIRCFEDCLPWRGSGCCEGERIAIGLDLVSLLDPIGHHCFLSANSGSKNDGEQRGQAAVQQVPQSDELNATQGVASLDDVVFPCIVNLLCIKPRAGA
jgi:hypothetical protein